MNFETFADKCIALFQEAKRKKSIAPPRVMRGRAGSCSSDCEDLLALGISEMIPQKFSLLVDYPLTIRNTTGERAETIYPDIAILCENRLIGIIEVKNDLGYMSEDWANKSLQNLEKLQNAESISYRKNVNMNIREPKTSIIAEKNIKQAVVVISGENAHGRMSALQGQHTCFILMPHYHPNHPNAAKDIKEIVRDSSGWTDFEKYMAAQYI